MILRDHLAAFWWHPTIDAMQAQMLREVRRLSRRPDIELLSRPHVFGSVRSVEPMLVGNGERIYHLNDFMIGRPQ